MRQQFIPYDEAENFDEAEDVAPWACLIYLVDGGFMAFESVTDADSWEHQQ